MQSCIDKGLFYCVEDSRYGHQDFLKEIGLYCVDAHGNPIDAWNHAMDEARYSVNYFCKTYVL